MPSPTTNAQVQLKSITTSLTSTASTLRILSDSLRDPVLMAMTNTTQSLLKCAETIKHNRDECVRLLESTYILLNAMISLYVKTETSNLPPQMLKQTACLVETLHKVHVFVEAQKKRGKIWQLLRQGEMNTLLKDCKTGLQLGLDFFHVNSVNLMTDLIHVQQDAQERHQDVLKMIEALAAGDNSDQESSISRLYSGSYSSSNSMSLLPSEPKIFHGRDFELAEILNHFGQTTPRIAILGPGGIGKTSLARAILHHTEVVTKFQQHRVFVACDRATSRIELAALIGAHLGLKPGKDLTRAVIDSFTNNPPSLLILDNLETLWEPTSLRKDIEDFLALLGNVNNLALMITMRGAERPAKVQWTRPFIQPLQPLSPEAARKMFVDIADDRHDAADVDKILLIADNMPLAISLLASLADSEDCSSVLSRWENEKTSIMSTGHDRRSNLDLSISISLSSPRMIAEPDSLQLLSLLSMLPDGLSDLDLVQSYFPNQDILRCKVILVRTSLAYIDIQKRVKVLVPIKEYTQKMCPPAPDMIHSVLSYYYDLVESHRKSQQDRIFSNYSNIQNILHNGLQLGHPDLESCIYGICYLNDFTQSAGRGTLPLLHEIQDSLLRNCSPQLEVYFIAELFSSAQHHLIPNP
ncbi:P-loop containing nucleoside triphosphate hydrolase protein, partial [Mycena polygramma]